MVLKLLSIGKRMKISLFFATFFILLTSSIQEPSPIPKPPSQAHAELKSHGFPLGLLPLSAKDYFINKTSGEFSLFLKGTCKVTLPPDNYLASYSNKVTGRISKGYISELQGIRIWGLFKWWYITGIRSSGENLVFEVGAVTAKYPSKSFVEILDCQGKRLS